MNASDKAIKQARLDMIAAGCLRSDSRMRNLCEAHFVRVVRWWITASLSLVDISARCATKPDDQIPEEDRGLGLPSSKSPSVSGLSDFFSAYGRYLVLATRSEDAVDANRFGEAARKAPVDWARVNADRIQQLVFLALNDLSIDSEVRQNLIKAFGKLLESDFKREKFQHDQQDKRQAGITALMDEFKGNAQAEALIKQLAEMKGDA